MKKVTKARLLGGLVLVCIFWVIGTYNTQPEISAILAFAFAVGYEKLVVDRIGLRSKTNSYPLNTSIGFQKKRLVATAVAVIVCILTICGLVWVGKAYIHKTSEWVELSEQSDGSVVSVFQDSIVTVGKYKSAWFMTNYRTPQMVSSFSYLSDSILMYFSCSEKTYEVMRAIEYAGKNREGISKEVVLPAQKVFNEIPSNPQADSYAKFVCEH